MSERYVLLEEIGSGGMGTVWKASDTQTGHVVALKLLHPFFAGNREYLTRFQREMQLASRIDSPRVVRVLGQGVRKGAPYLVLEYVDGPSLRERLSEHGRYSWPQTRALLGQIAAGLADVHAAGVIHRDLKPSNVLISSGGAVKLADFGIARGVDLTRVTGTSTVLGTPAYLAPEGPKDERSDLYGLGVIAYELLTGIQPFSGTDYQEVIIRHIREAPDLAKIPAEARPIVSRLLAKDPQDRPQSAREVLAMLASPAGVSMPNQGRQAVSPARGSGRPSSARNGPERGLSSPRPMRSRRAALAIAGVAALAFILVLALTLPAILAPSSSSLPTLASDASPRDPEVILSEGFEGYGTGALGQASKGRWIQAESGRVGDVTDVWVHSGSANLQINSFVPKTEILYAPLNLTFKPTHLTAEFWYTPDGYFIYADFARVGLAQVGSKFDLQEVASLWGVKHEVFFKASGMSESTVFDELEYATGPADMGSGTPVHNYIRMEFDMGAKVVRVYIGADQSAPLRTTTDIGGLADFNAFYVAGGLNPTYIDDIKITAW